METPDRLRSAMDLAAGGNAGTREVSDWEGADRLGNTRLDEERGGSTTSQTSPWADTVVAEGSEAVGTAGCDSC